LFYKIGPSPSTLKGGVKTPKDNGMTWREAKALPEGFYRTGEKQTAQVGKHRLIATSSKEGKGWQVHFEIQTILVSDGRWGSY
jgi:hypothetical protein